MICRADAAPPARAASGPARGERVPLDLKIAFGAPTFASAALVLPIVIHLPKFYADQSLVPLGLLAIVVAVGRAFDAITDPLVGWLSDRTRSRWGRRWPYLAVGAPLCAVSLYLHSRVGLLAPFDMVHPSATLRGDRGVASSDRSPSSAVGVGHRYTVVWGGSRRW